MRINKDDYFVLFLLFIFSLVLFQCFVIPSVLYRSAPLFRRYFDCSSVVPLFRWCSVVSGWFRSSASVPCSVVPCSGVPGFIVCPSRTTESEDLVHAPLHFVCEKRDSNSEKRTCTNSSCLS